MLLSSQDQHFFKADFSGKLSVSDGELLELSCVSKGGKPAAGINWKIDGSLVEDEVVTNTELESNGLRFTTIASLKVKVSETVCLDCVAS